jgi:hypothetical protein
MHQALFNTVADVIHALFTTLVGVICVLFITVATFFLLHYFFRAHTKGRRSVARSLG